MTRYELLDRIGVGGMAEIFRGRALAAGGFEKPVAIKRILPHLCQDQRFVELLIAEAKVLSLLRHRNIVQIFDVGLGDDGQYFLVMEFVKGLDLGRVQAGLEAKRRLLPVDLALHIGAEICEALEHAHSARDPEGTPIRLVHRDIAPSNVLLSLAGEVKLTDFGIAKRAEEVTTHGGVRGKFAYISPEQAKNEPVDPRSDVFSLGIVLFELLTGRRLFSQLPDLEALRGVREGKIPRLREMDGNLPPPIDDLIGKALARDPDMRYASAGEFGAALRSLRYSLEVSSGDPSAELARVVSTAESPATIPPKNQQFEPGEATVIRIQSAEAFSMNDARTAISQARQVIDRFEEEETRMSKLGGETLRNLRRVAEEHSGELAVPPVQQAPRRAGRDTRDVRGGSERRGEGRSAPRDPRLDPRQGSITGDEPTSLADPLDQQRMMSAAADKFELEEETIARPSLRLPAPATLKRPPPGTGPGGAGSGGASGPLPGMRGPRAMSPPLPGTPSTGPSMMPDAAGWEAPSFVASPYATPAPERASMSTPNPMGGYPVGGPSMSPNPMSPPPMSNPNPMGGYPVGGPPMSPPMGNPMGDPMAGVTPNPMGGPSMSPMGGPVGGPMGPPLNGGMGAVPNPAMMQGGYGYSGYAGEAPVAPAYPPRGFEPRTGVRPEGGTALERWRTAALVLGAVTMAVLAFAVTRSCLHQEKRPAATSAAPPAATSAAPPAATSAAPPAATSAAPAAGASP